MNQNSHTGAGDLAQWFSPPPEKKPYKSSRGEIIPL
jgi:hypothetical protein